MVIIARRQDIASDREECKPGMQSKAGRLSHLALYSYLLMLPHVAASLPAGSTAAVNDCQEVST